VRDIKMSTEINGEKYMKIFTILNIHLIFPEKLNLGV
jgi:hypothetical protein